MHATLASPAAGDPGRAPAFRWADVALEDRDWLRRRTEDVTGTAYRIGCDFARLGMVLKEVRGRVPRGQFDAWLTAETPFSRAHAYRLIQVGEAFGGYVSQIETIEPTALYLLSSPTVPGVVRAHVVTLAETGKPVTRAVALEVLKAHKAKVWGGGAERKADMTALAQRMEPIRETEKKQREQAKKDPDSPETRAKRMAELGEALALLTAECSVVHVTRIEEDEDAPLYSVTTYREDDSPRNAVEQNLLDALRAVSGREPVKKCPTCKEVKGLSKFGELVSSPKDGRNRCCKKCERIRIAGSKKRSKVRRAEARPPAADPGT